MPSLPPGSTVRVGGRTVPSEQVSAARRRGGARRGPAGGARSRSRWWWSPRRCVVVVAGRAGCSARCTRSRPRRGGCRPSRWTPAPALRDARGEVAELAAGFDAMLDRLQAAFEAQRRFVANASHELRTPLAVLRTEVDVTLVGSRPPTSTELRRMGAVVREATPPGRRPGRGPAAAGPDRERRRAVGARAPAGPRRPGRARARRGAGRRDRAAACGCCCARAPGADGGRPGAAGAGGRQPAWRTRCGTTSRAGWLEVCTGRAGGDGAPRAVLSCGWRPAGRRCAPERVDELFEPFRRGPVERTGAAPRRGAGPLDRPRGGARARRHGGGRTGAGRRAHRGRAPPGTRRSAAGPCGTPTHAGQGADSRSVPLAEVGQATGRARSASTGASSSTCHSRAPPSRSAAATSPSAGGVQHSAAQQVGLQQVLHRASSLRRDRRQRRPGRGEPRGGGRVAVGPAGDRRWPVARWSRSAGARRGRGAPPGASAENQ